MWLLTTDGFYSAVEHREDPTVLLVRSRARKDLETMLDVAYAQEKKPKIVRMKDADYEFRVEISRAKWFFYVGNAAQNIDYDNFKDAVALVDKERSQIYMGVWIALRNIGKRFTARDHDDTPYDVWADYVPPEERDYDCDGECDLTCEHEPCVERSWRSRYDEPPMTRIRRLFGGR